MGGLSSEESKYNFLSINYKSPFIAPIILFIEMGLLNLILVLLCSNVGDGLNNLFLNFRS